MSLVLALVPYDTLTSFNIGRGMDRSLQSSWLL